MNAAERLMWQCYAELLIMSVEIHGTPNSTAHFVWQIDQSRTVMNAAERLRWQCYAALLINPLKGKEI